MTRTALALALGSAIASLARPVPAASEAVWVNPADSTYMTIPSRLRAGAPAEDVEAADDFDVVGTIEKVEVGGHHCLSCAPSDVRGAFVRFYAWTPAGPGALQAEHHLVAPDPRLVYDPVEPAVLEVTLPAPFAATGRHFVSVQLELGAGQWEWWVSGWAAPQLSRLWHRDAARGSGWTPYPHPLGGVVEADLTLKLWGTDATPPPAGTDPCGTWVEVASPSPAATRHVVLRDLAAVAPDDVWAVGESVELVPGGQVTLTHTAHWDGTAWTIVPSPSPHWAPDAAWSELNAVAGDGAGSVWAAGTQVMRNSDGFVGGQVLVERWDGAAWRVVPSPLTPAGGSGAVVRGIEVVAPDDVWFVGDWVDGTPGAPRQPGLAMRWNGAGFELHNTPFVSASGTGLEAASALAPDDVWAVGGGGDGDWTAASNIFHWDGTAWAHRPGPTPGYFQRLNDVAAIAPDDVWAVGEYQDVAGLLPLVLHWDGASWTQLVGSDAGSSSLLALAADDVYSTGGGIHHWDGTSWSRVADFPEVNEAAESVIAAAGPCQMWVAGRKVEAGLIVSFTARIDPAPLRLDVLRDDSLRAPLDPGHLDLGRVLPLASPGDVHAAGATGGWLEPDPVTADAARPLVFYAVDGDAVLRLVRADASVRLDF